MVLLQPFRGCAAKPHTRVVPKNNGVAKIHVIINNRALSRIRVSQILIQSDFCFFYSIEKGFFLPAGALSRQSQASTK